MKIVIKNSDNPLSFEIGVYIKTPLPPACSTSHPRPMNHRFILLSSKFNNCYY